jgi:hypothetical protein
MSAGLNAVGVAGMDEQPGGFGPPGVPGALCVPLRVLRVQPLLRAICV